MKSTLSAAFAVLVGAGLVAGLGYGGWQLYWASEKSGIERRYDVNINSQQYQSGLISQERDRVQAFDVAADPAQKAQIKSTFCEVAKTFTVVPADLAEAQSRIC